MNWEQVSFDTIFSDRTAGNQKTLCKDYLLVGAIPILDQGQDSQLGYTNDEKSVCNIKLPCILFGDHTKKLVLQSERFALGADGVKVLEPSDNVDIKFAFYQLASYEFPTNTGYSRHFKYLRKNIFSLPPLNEQRRIADRIDALQAKSRRAREALQEAQVLLKQFRQSVLHAAFRGDLTATWREEHPDAQPAAELLKRIRTERRKRWEEAEQTKYQAKGKTPPPGWQKKYPEPVQVDTTELPELPLGWCWASLDELSHTVQYGTSEKSHNTGTLPVLRMGNIVDGQLCWDKLKYFHKEEVPADLLLNSGDILFNRTNSIELVGKSAVFRGDLQATFASYLIRVVTILVIPELIANFINSSFGRSWVLSVANQQVGQANVNGTKLKSLAVPIPSEAEQIVLTKKIHRLQSIAANIFIQAQTAVEQNTSLDQSILAKAFRGDLVPQDPNDEPASVLLERIRKEPQSAPPVRGRRKKE